MLVLVQGAHAHQNKQVRMQGFSNDGSSRGGTQTQLNIPLASGNNSSPINSNGGTRRNMFSNAAADPPWFSSPASNDAAVPPGPERSGMSRSSLMNPLARLRSRMSSSALVAAQGPDSLRATGALSREASNYGGGGPDSGGMSPLRGRSRVDLTSDASWLSPNVESSARSFSGSPARRRKSTLDEMSAPWLRPVASSGQEGEEPTQPLSGTGDGTLPASSPAAADGASDLAAAQSPEAGQVWPEDPRAPSKLPGSPGSGGDTLEREAGHPRQPAEGSRNAQAPIGDPDHAEASIMGYIPAAELGAFAMASLAGYLPSQPLLPNGNGSASGSSRGSRPSSAAKPAKGSRPSSAVMPTSAAAAAAAAASGSPASATNHSSGAGADAAGKAASSDGGASTSAGPGPVAESLMQEPSSPARSNDGDEPTVLKRGRTGVSFTTGLSGGEDMLSPPLQEPASANRSRVQSARSRAASRGASRVASREASATGNMMAGLRTMARNLTLRIGQVLVGKGGEGGGPGYGGMEEEGGGGTARRGGADPSPRQSQAGGAGDASIFVPSNPWEWQEHYNEKVDCWQVREYWEGLRAASGSAL